MNKIILALAAAGALTAIAAPALAGPVSGAVIGAGTGAVVAGPPGAVVGGVIGAVVGGPNLHYYHHHRVHMDGQRHYYNDHNGRHYF
jgi:osmotically inducible lipoprotein OsmB